jgi:hypothetical protein
MNCSLIVIHYGDPSLTESLLESLQSHPDSLYFDEIVIVDNGCGLTDSEIESFSSTELVTKVVQNQGTSYASGVNIGVEASTGEFLIICNNDIEWVVGNSIGPALATLTKEGVGIVGPQQVYPDGSWQRSFGKLPTVSNEICSLLFLDTVSLFLSRLLFQLGVCRVVTKEYIDGAFLLIDRNCFEELNGFDENFSFYCEESDFCYRAENQGWGIISDTRAQILHIGGASSSQKDEIEFASRLGKAKQQYVRKHQGHLPAKIFNILQQISVFERAQLYSVLNILFGGEWGDRAMKAKKRYEGLTQSE